jgi:hypothetical protein
MLRSQGLPIAGSNLQKFQVCIQGMTKRRALLPKLFHANAISDEKDVPRTRSRTRIGRAVVAHDSHRWYLVLRIKQTLA